MFENRTPISYCKLKNGNVEVSRGKDKDGNRIVQMYDRIVARVTGITEKTGEYNGEKIKSWNIHLEDANGELAILSIGHSSGFTRGLFNCLANADLSRPLSISCYVKSTERGDMNCPSLSQDNELIRWKYPEMPKTEKVMVGSKEVINDEKALAWMMGVVDEIIASIPTKKPEVTGPSKPVGEMSESEIDEVLGCVNGGRDMEVLEGDDLPF